MIRMTVPMRPRGQERARHAVRTTATGGRYAVTYTPQATRDAAARIRAAWVDAGAVCVPAGEAFTVEVVATTRRPDAHTLKTGAPSKAHRSHPRRPDVDNLLKLVLDALQPDCFADDALCVTATVAKGYGDEDSIAITIAWS
jgi:Holliday junction resolvase RusA-like endonuclease